MTRVRCRLLAGRSQRSGYMVCLLDLRKRHVILVIRGHYVSVSGYQYLLGAGGNGFLFRALFALAVDRDVGAFMLLWPREERQVRMALRQ